jgi:hypothetical protein
LSTGYEPIQITATPRRAALHAAPHSTPRRTPRRAACRLPPLTTTFPSPPSRRGRTSPPPEEDIADDKPPPHTEPATIMAPAVTWSTKRVPVLETDAANIQAWLAAALSSPSTTPANYLPTQCPARLQDEPSRGRFFSSYPKLSTSRSAAASLIMTLPRHGLPFLLCAPPTPWPSKTLPPPFNSYASPTSLFATTRDFTVPPTLLFTTWTPAITMPPY